MVSDERVNQREAMGIAGFAATRRKLFKRLLIFVVYTFNYRTQPLDYLKNKNYGNA